MVVLGFAGVTAFAAPSNGPAISSAVVDYTTMLLTILGQNFSPSGTAPVVASNGVKVTLATFSTTVVVANLSDGIVSGSYQLMVTNPTLRNQPGVINMTIGAAGPVGPKAHGDRRALLERQAHKDLRACKDLPGLQDCRAHRAYRGLLNRQDRRGRLDRKDQLGRVTSPIQKVMTITACL